jgi:Protein of unknown function (DUF664)
VGTDNPCAVNWVVVVRRSGEDGDVTKQHRADRFLDLEADPRRGGTSLGDERATLVEFLRRQRLTLQVKCEGLTAAQLASRAVEPSSRRQCRCLAWCDTWRRSNAGGFGGGSPARTCPGDTSATTSPTATSTVPNPIRGSWRKRGPAWHEEIAFAEQFARDTDLGFIGRDWAGNPISLRELLVHMIEEYARHDGHADLLRERIDGRIGQ